MTERLTPEEMVELSRLARGGDVAARNRIVERAWLCSRGIREKFEKRMRGPDYDGYVAMRLVLRASQYDADQSWLPAWACHEAAFACRDARRSYSPIGTRARGERPFSVLRESDDPEAFEHQLGRLDQSDMEEREAFDHMVSSLDRRSQCVLRLLYCEGWRPVDIARTFGMQESTVCRIHQGAINKLRVTLGEKQLAS